MNNYKSNANKKATSKTKQRRIDIWVEKLKNLL